jgi:CDP-glycerol glycerophosphotransferase (TagB/SpsB family)
MRKKVIIHSMNLKHMDSMIEYYNNHHLKGKFKLVTIETNNSNRLIQKIKKLYYMYIGKYDAVVSDYQTRLLEKGKTISIAMGHGTAIKKYPSDAELLDKRNLRLCKTYKAANYFITTSERQNKLEFRNEILEIESKNEYLSLGLPKNDYYFDSVKVNKTNKVIREELGFLPNNYVLLYAPTWRNYKIDNNYFSESNLMKLNELLQKKDAYMIYRPHVLGGTIDRNLLKSSQYDRILDCQDLNIDVFQSLCISNAIITDYSSIAIEYLPLNRPIIFYLFDQEEYDKNRGIEFNYYDESISPGPVVKTIDELLDVCKDTINNESNSTYWRNRRNICLKNHYKYPDGKSAERIWSLILSKINY